VTPIELAYVDQGYTGDNAAQAAEKHGVAAGGGHIPRQKRGFVLLPAPLGGGKKLCLGSPLSADWPETMNGLEKTLAGLDYLAFRHPDARKPRSTTHAKLITGSKQKTAEEWAERRLRG